MGSSYLLCESCHLKVGADTDSSRLLPLSYLGDARDDVGVLAGVVFLVAAEHSNLARLQDMNLDTDGRRSVSEQMTAEPLAEMRTPGHRHGQTSALTSAPPGSPTPTPTPTPTHGAFPLLQSCSHTVCSFTVNKC